MTTTKAAPEPEMATNGAPDNWDDGMDVSNKMEALNVNAASFVPNVNAPSFVPSWGPPAPASSSPVTAPDDKMQVDQGTAAPEPAPVTGNGPGRPAPAPADSWEDKADLSSTATTPEDEDMSMEDDTGETNFSTAVRNFRQSDLSRHHAFVICTNYY